MNDDLGYDERPVAVALEHTMNVVQPSVAVVDTWRVMGMGLSLDAGGEAVKHLVQANLYHTCFDTSGTPTVAFQATVIMEAEAAVKLALDLIEHGSAIKKGVGSRKLQDDARALVDRRLKQLQQELKDLCG